MSEARELLERALATAEERCEIAAANGLSHERDSYATIAIVMRAALATQPEPGAVPELPEWVEEGDSPGEWKIRTGNNGRYALMTVTGDASIDDLDRIAEACTKLAARERARRAQS